MATRASVSAGYGLLSLLGILESLRIHVLYLDDIVQQDRQIVSNLYVESSLANQAGHHIARTKAEAKVKMKSS